MFEGDCEVWDDVKGCALDPAKVKEARRVEMGYVDKHQVYEYAPISECRQKTGAEPIETRWIDTNKGDTRNPNYRSRWVAKQFRRAWIETVFSATPSIEAVRLLLADAANRCSRGHAKEGEVCIMIIDISRAYFYAPAQKEIFIKLPLEDPRFGEEGVCGKVLQVLTGTKLILIF